MDVVRDSSEQVFNTVVSILDDYLSVTRNASGSY